ncbi:MAG: DUF4321 domain-containing protein [Clostridia bacterium]
MGVLLGDLAASVSWLKFLSFGFDFGITEPAVLNLGIMKVTLGFWMKLNLAGVIGLITAAIVSNKVLRK